MFFPTKEDLQKTYYHKLTSVDEYAARCLLCRGGAIPTSEWTTGSGRFTKLRAVPFWAKVIENDENCTHPGAKKLFKSRPRLQKAIVAERRTLNNIINKKVKKVKVVNPDRIHEKIRR